MDFKTLNDGKEQSRKGVPHIKVSKYGPYIVTGNVPLTKMIIETDNEGYPYQWKDVETLPHWETYSLCRCGKSSSMPFCDKTHIKSGFDGTETAGYDLFLDNVKIYNGPELKLADNKPLCVNAGFCARAGNIWNLVTHSDFDDNKEIAVQEAADCPSGRLVVWDNDDVLIEPFFEYSIVLTVDYNGEDGPLWVRGGVPISSADGTTYEKRNRVTLCNCGRSKNKPFCDGSHLE